MEILRNISKITAMLLLCNSLSYAGWKTVADEQVAIQTTSPTTLKTSLTSSFAGGGARVQWQNLGSTSIINVTAPKASIGCNGIEIGFGSISFLDFDSLVNKLKMIASQAPAFAFKMAIDTACSQCSTIMQDLEQAVEAINNFSLDSCAIAESIGNPIGASLGNLVNPSSSRYSDSYSAQKANTEDTSTFKLNDLKDTINSWNDTINGKSLKLEKLKGYGSFLNNLRINKIPSMNRQDPKDFIDLLRTLIGDVVGYMDAKNDNQDTYTYINPNPGSNINDLIALFVGKKTGTFQKTLIILEGNNSSWDQVELTNMPKGFKADYNRTDLNFDDSDTGNTSNKSWTYKIKESLKTVTNKMKNDTALTSDDYVYLQNLPFNGYKIINYFGATSQTSGAITLDEYAEYIAIENARSQFDLLLDLAGRALSEYMNEVDKSKKISSEDRKKFQDVVNNIAIQKQLLTHDENIKRIPSYIEKIKKLQSEDMKINKQERLK
jgi:conjugative transfer pilus assembly protein TraH